MYKTQLTLLLTAASLLPVSPAYIGRPNIEIHEGLIRFYVPFLVSCAASKQYATPPQATTCEKLMD